MGFKDWAKANVPPINMPKGSGKKSPELVRFRPDDAIHYIRNGSTNRYGIFVRYENFGEREIVYAGWGDTREEAIRNIAYPTHIDSYHVRLGWPE